MLSTSQTPRFRSRRQRRFIDWTLPFSALLALLLAALVVLPMAWLAYTSLTGDAAASSPSIITDSSSSTRRS